MDEGEQLFVVYLLVPKEFLMTMRHKKEIGIHEMESKIVKGASFCTLDHLTHAITKYITRLNGQTIST